MPRIESWAKFDRQTVSNRENKVDHAASAKANLTEAKKNVSDVFHANHFEEVEKSDGILGPALGLVLAPWLAAAEVYDVVAAPVKVAKNVADAAVHGVANLFDGK